MGGAVGGVVGSIVDGDSVWELALGVVEGRGRRGGMDDDGDDGDGNGGGDDDDGIVSRDSIGNVLSS